MADMNDVKEKAKTGLAFAFEQATRLYNKMMDPIREMNEYVTKKNELDAHLTDGSLTDEGHVKQVKALQEEYFTDSESKRLLADKFERVSDWKEEHGINEIEDKVFNAAGNIKDKFAQTTAGQTISDKWQAFRKEMEDMQNSGDVAQTDSKADQIDKGACENSAYASKEAKNAARVAMADAATPKSAEITTSYQMDV